MTRIFKAIYIVLGGGALAWVLFLRLYPHTPTTAPSTAPAEVVQTATLTSGPLTIPVSISDTPVLRKQGLSGRTTLPPNAGMLFMFDGPGTYSFWMKDMQFPLDIIWLSSDFRIVGIAEHISPATYPHTFQSPPHTQYVLEVNTGYAQAHSLFIGQSFVFQQ
jgi:uncharacterized protein